jgi:hypothetical protein
MLSTVWADAVPAGSFTPIQTTYRAVSLTPGESGAVKVGWLFPSEIDPVLMFDGTSLVGHDVSTEPVEVSHCPPDPLCPSPTDSVTVREGSAKIENGLLFLILDGERNLCCSKMHFVAHFIGGPGALPSAQ